MKFVGIDVGKYKCAVAVMDSEGRISDEFAFHNNNEGIGGLISRLSMDDMVVMESTGSVWANLYNRLEQVHIKVVLANPLKTKAIASARIKSDKVDARILAHLLRADLIPPSYVPPYEIREMRSLLRHRASLVKVRTMVKNKVHSLLDGKGVSTAAFSDLFGKRGVEWLRRVELSTLDRLMLDNHLEHLESLKRQVEAVDREITSRASRDEYVKLLLSMTGVDVYTALLIRSEIGDISRFSSYKKLISWAGLAPSLHQSGSVEYHGHITKQGSRMLRWIMVEAARVAANNDARLSEFYERVKQRRGNQKAVVAVACKMLKIIWTMLTKDEPYESRNQRRYDKKLNFMANQ
jgi:transposase